MMSVTIYHNPACGTMSWLLRAGGEAASMMKEAQ